MNRKKVMCIIVMLLIVGATSNASDKNKDAGMKKIIAHGAYLVNLGGCNDCHSPKVFTKMGPVPDTSRLLSGSQADMPLPEIPEGVLGPGKWGVLSSGDFTAWVGPWGVSFARNLTPDVETGLGSWTEDMFIKALRTGKDMGVGRDILPPMPWPSIGQLTDADLKAIFAYLHSLKPIKNAVREPIPPAMDANGETKMK